MADHDRQATLLRLGDALHAAGAAAGWTLLGVHARALGSQLQALAALGPWTAAERAALQRLRELHASAAGRVDGAAQTLESRLHALRDQQEGWLAYAMHSETEDGERRTAP